MIRARLVGFGALLLLGVAVVGVPTALLAIAGNPVPTAVPALDDIRTSLTSPDDGTLLFGAIRVVAWAAWVVLTLSIVIETFSRLRGARSPRLPGLGLPQAAARQLVAAAALLFVVAVPTVASVASPAQAATPPTVAVTASVEAPVPMTPIPVQAAAPEQADAATASYTVVEGDSLWKIAQTQLGDPHRWQEVYQLNVGVVQADGYALGDAGWVEPGWQLVLPADSQVQQTVPEHSYTVQHGDTLSQIAADELGDASRYPEIFAASTDTVQPDGRHLTDPDLIYPGWEVTIPGTVVPGTPAGPVEAPPQQGPTMEPTVPQVLDETAGLPGAAASDYGTVGASASQTGQEQTSPDSVQDSDRGVGAQEWAPWVLAGLTGGGAVLAGSLWLALRARRRAQFRYRLPGRTLAAPGPLLAPVEKTVVTVGATTAEMVAYLDAVLRRLGAVVAAGGGAMPDLVAVELTGGHVVLHLGAPWQLGAPWEGADDGHRWQVPVGLDLDLVGPGGEHPAPYPLLVTVGASDDGAVWLFNAEDLAITLTGDAERARDFGRYLVAEIGCSPWAAWTTVECVGLGAELVGLNPDRIRYHAPGSPADPVGTVLAEAMATVGRSTAAGADVVTARSMEVGADSWAPRVVLVDAISDDPALDPLLDLVVNHAGRTATSVVLAGARPSGDGGVHIEVTAEGRIRLPEVGLDLAAVGLDVTEAGGCAGLVAHADLALDPVSVPYDDTTDQTDWRTWSDAAGALRPEHTLSRADTWYDPAETSSLLPAPDETYVAAAATTPDDLAVLAPRVSAEVRLGVEATDPGLDDDLAAWYDLGTTRPKLRVLGPAQVAAQGNSPARREPFFTELVAYLALHPQGVTPTQVADAFATSKGKIREYLRIVREWLGVDLDTSLPYLPEARQVPGATEPVYQVADVLVDLDLFRRLRVRGQARGADGVGDLLAALRLIGGRPFDDPTRWRPGGWAWLVDSDRIDESALVAVVDTAHTVVTQMLATGDLTTARQAAQTALLADPYDEIIRLDLAAVASAEGRFDEAVQIISQDIGNRSDDGHAPPELSPRTQEVIAVHPEWTTTRAS